MWTSWRIKTEARGWLADEGVTEENVEAVNSLCGRLLRVSVLPEVVFGGRYRLGMMLGVAGIVFGVVVFFGMSCWGIASCLLKGKKQDVRGDVDA